MTRYSTSLTTSTGEGSATPSRKGWRLDLLIGCRWARVYTAYPHRLLLVVGPWNCYVGPWSRDSRYANGSHWTSGWHRGDDELDW